MEADNIRKREFSRRFRGLNPEEVAELQEEAAQHVEELQSNMEELVSRLKRAEHALAKYRERETGLEATLKQTRQAAEDIKENAERESQLMVAEAELQAEKILGQAHNRLAQIHDDISELKRQRAQFEVRLRSLVEAHLKLLDVESERDRDLAELEDKIKILRSPTQS